MIAASQKYADRHLAVLGLGRSGVPAARLAHRLGARVTVLDSGHSEALERNAAELRAGGLHCVLGEEALTCADRFDLAVLSPGIDPAWPIAANLTARGVKAIGEVEFAAQNTSLPCIAVTGTNGKTTTTELIAAILNGAGVKSLAWRNAWRESRDAAPPPRPAIPRSRRHPSRSLGPRPAWPREGICD